MSKAVEGAILLIEAVAEAGPGGISQAELAKTLGTSEASVSRLCGAWETHGYLEETAKGVRLGRRCGELWRAYRRGLKLAIAEAAAALRATAVEEDGDDHQ